jgi:hypothetical protein
VGFALTNDQYLIIISRLRELCNELKKHEKLVDEQTKAIKENTEVLKEILKNI